MKTDSILIIPAETEPRRLFRGLGARTVIGVLLWIGFLLFPRPSTFAEESLGPDLRIAKLEDFFRDYGCPQGAIDLTGAYIHSADNYQLDWRLLPAIAIQESSCHENYSVPTHNPWGWANGVVKFKSLDAGIDEVTRELAEGEAYIGKSLDEKLRTYNRNPAYKQRVKQWMEKISQSRG